MGKYDDTIGGGKLILDVEEVLNEESAKKVDDRIKKQKADLETPIEINVKSDKAENRLKELAKAAKQVKADLQEAIFSQKSFGEISKIVSKYELLKKQIKAIAPEVSKNNSSLKEGNQILKDTKKLIDQLTVSQEKLNKTRKTKKGDSTKIETKNTKKLIEVADDATKTQEKAAKTKLRTQQQVNAELDKELQKLKDIEDQEKRNDAARERFKRKQGNYGQEVLGVNHAVYDTDLLKSASKDLEEFNKLLETRNKYQEKYISLCNIIEKYYLSDKPGKYGIDNGLYRDFDQFFKGNSSLKQLEIYSNNGQKTTNKQINELFKNVVADLRSDLSMVERLISSGEATGALIGQDLGREETELNREMQRLLEAHEEQLGKINDLRQKELDLIKEIGQEESKNADIVETAVIKQGQAYDKVVKRALNMESVIKRYNKLIGETVRDGITIGLEYPETKTWNVRDMVSEVQHYLDLYNSDDNMFGELKFGDVDERKAWKSETGKLKRFINTYRSYIDDLVVSASHGSLFDNLPSVKPAIEEQKQLTSIIEETTAAREKEADVIEKGNKALKNRSKIKIREFTQESYDTHNEKYQQEHNGENEYLEDTIDVIRKAHQFGTQFAADMTTSCSRLETAVRRFFKALDPSQYPELTSWADDMIESVQNKTFQEKSMSYNGLFTGEYTWGVEAVDEGRVYVYLNLLDVAKDKTKEFSEYLEAENKKRDEGLEKEAQLYREIGNKYKELAKLRNESPDWNYSKSSDQEESIRKIIGYYEQEKTLIRDILGLQGEFKAIPAKYKSGNYDASGLSDYHETELVTDNSLKVVDGRLEVYQEALDEFVSNLSEAVDKIEPQIETNKKLISSYEQLFDMVKEYVDLAGQLKPINTSEYENIQLAIDKVRFTDDLDEIIAEIKAWYTNVQRIKSSSKQGLSVYKHTYSDGEEREFSVGAETLKNAELTLNGYIYRAIEYFGYTVADVMNDFSQKRVRTFVANQISKYLDVSAANDVYEIDAKAFNAPIEEAMERISSTILSVVTNADGIGKVEDKLYELSTRAYGVNRYTLSRETNYIGRFMEVKTADDEIRENARRIESYEELCSIVARYTDLQKNSYVYGGTDYPGLNESEEKEYRELIARLEKTSGKSLWDISDFGNIRDIDKLAITLGIEIPNAVDETVEANKKLESSYEGLVGAVEQYVTSSQKLWEAYDKHLDFNKFAEERNAAIEKIVSMFPDGRIMGGTSAGVYFQDQRTSRLYASKGAEATLADIENQLTRSKEEQVRLAQEAESAALAKITLGSSGKTLAGTKPINFKYAVMSVEDLVMSHDAYGVVNPDYPTELQPRDRNRMASKTQILGMVKNLLPELLVASPTAQNGSPIVSNDGIVVGGNARSAALAEAYATGHADGYKSYITEHASEFGLDPNNMPKNPVLVRVVDIDGGLDTLAKQLNESTTAGYSTTEQALINEELIMKVISKLNIDESANLNSEANKDFVRSFMSLLPDDQKNEMMTKDGSLSAVGLVKVKQALFGAAYGSKEMLENLEQISPEFLNISNALMASAAQAADIRYFVENGVLNDLGVISTILNGVDLLKTARHNNYNIEGYLSQTSLLDSGYTAEDVAIGKFLEANTRNATQLKNMIDIILDFARGAGDPNQISLGGFSEVTLSDVIKGAFTKYAEQYQKKIDYDKLIDGHLPAEAGSRSDKRVDRTNELAAEVQSTQIIEENTKAKQDQTDAAQDATKQTEAQAKAEEKIAEAANKTADAKERQIEATKDVTNIFGDQEDTIGELLNRDVEDALAKLRTALNNKTDLIDLSGVHSSNDLEDALGSTVRKILGNDSILEFEKVRATINDQGSVATIHLINEGLGITATQLWQIKSNANEAKDGMEDFGEGSVGQLQHVADQVEYNRKSAEKYAKTQKDALDKSEKSLLGYQKRLDTLTRSYQHGSKILKGDNSLLLPDATTLKDDANKTLDGLAAHIKDRIDTIRKQLVSGNKMTKDDENLFIRDLNALENEIKTMQADTYKGGNLSDTEVNELRKSLTAMLEILASRARENNVFDAISESYQKLYNNLNKSELPGYLSNQNISDAVQRIRTLSKETAKAIQIAGETKKEQRDLQQLLNLQERLYEAKKKFETLEINGLKEDSSDYLKANRTVKELEAQYNAAKALFTTQKQLNQIKDRESALQKELDAVVTEQKQAKNNQEEKTAEKEQAKNIQQTYKSVLDLVNKINAKSTEITKYQSKDGGSGIFAGYIEQLQSDKARLVSELKGVTDEINNTLGSGFVQGKEFSVPFASFLDDSGAISNFLNDTRTQASLATEEIEKLVAALQKSQNIDVQAATKVAEQFKSVQETYKRLSGLTGLDKGNANYQALVGVFGQIMKYKESLSSDPTSWTPEESSNLQTLIDQFTKYGNALADVGEKEARYFAGKNKYISGDQAGNLDDHFKNQTKAVNEAQKQLENAARKFAKDSGFRDAIITKFSQMPDGISRIDFSVFDERAKSLRNFHMEMGNVTDGIYRSETTISKSLANMKAAEKQMEKTSNLLVQLDASGINISEKDAPTSVANLLKARDNLATALHEGDQNAIVRYTQELKNACVETEKLHKQTVQMNEAIANEQAKDIGRGDPKGNIYSQLVEATKEYIGVNKNATIEFGRFDAATNTLDASLTHTNGTVETFKVQMSGLNGQMTAQQTGVKQVANSWDQFKASVSSTAKQLATAVVGYNVFYKAMAEIRKGVGYVKEIDLAMTELKKVTDETEASYKKFLDTAANKAGEIGSTVSDFTEATANFARLNI